MITGVILAGGQSSRMGGKDKGLMTVNGQRLYQRVLDRLATQVDAIIINANRHQQIYRQSGYPVIGDINRDFAGPLAGIYTGLRQAATKWVVFAPCDVPDLPLDLVSRLQQGAGNSSTAYVTDGQREHPTLLLAHTRIAPELETYLAQGDRKLLLFLNQIGARPVSFSDQPQAFRNLNTLDDVLQWQQDHPHA